MWRWLFFNGICDVVKGLFNSLFQQDYFDPCVYGNNGDEEVNVNVDDDDDKEINCCFKDLNFQELENMKANGHHHNIYFKI